MNWIDQNPEVALTILVFIYIALVRIYTFIKRRE